MKIYLNRKSNKNPSAEVFYLVLTTMSLQVQQSVSLCPNLSTHQSSTIVLELIAKSSTSLVSSCQTNRDPEALRRNVYQTNSYVTEDKACKIEGSYNNYEKLAPSFSRFAEKPERNHQKRRPGGQKAQAKWVKKCTTRLGTMWTAADEEDNNPTISWVTKKWSEQLFLHGVLGNGRLLRIGGEHRSRPSAVHYAAQPLLTGPIEGNSLTFDSAWVITSNRLSCEVAALTTVVCLWERAATL